MHQIMWFNKSKLKIIEGKSDQIGFLQNSTKRVEVLMAKEFNAWQENRFPFYDRKAVLKKTTL